LHYSNVFEQYFPNDQKEAKAVCEAFCTGKEGWLKLKQSFGAWSLYEGRCERKSKAKTSLKTQDVLSLSIFLV
jgi:hypothetical protein